jgi:hypothetical protein
MTEQKQSLEQLAKKLNLDKTQDFMTFKSIFFTAYDFEKIKSLARQLNVKRTGSRSATWKVSIVLMSHHIANGSDASPFSHFNEKGIFLNLRQFNVLITLI